MVVTTGLEPPPKADKSDLCDVNAALPARFALCNIKSYYIKFNGGFERTRTSDLFDVNEAL
jgi:hypothetical protein